MSTTEYDILMQRKDEDGNIEIHYPITHLDNVVGSDELSHIGHTHTKSEVGLGNVDNTADMDKPVSTAVQAALDEKVDKDGAVTSVAGKTGVVTLTKTDVGLGNVDNVKQATKVEFDAHKNDKENPHGVTAEQVGLGSVNNTSDADKPVSNAQQAALDAKADKQTEQGGFAGGGDWTGPGYYNQATTGAAVGYAARQMDGTEPDDKGGAAAGELASVTGSGAAIGARANVYGGGGAVGDGAEAGDGFAGGKGASTMIPTTSEYIDAIQLGTGQNVTPKTFKVYEYELMDADGNIPAERLGNSPGSVAVVDNLTSSSPTSALSANQGKILNDTKANLETETGGFEGGHWAYAGGLGGAIGSGSTAGDGFAGGKGAETIDSTGDPIDAIQLGTGTNSKPKTLKVYNYDLMDADGKIPAERLPDVGSGGVGKDLEGETLSPIEGTGFVAETGAEIYNDYRERTFVSYAAANGNVATGSYSHAEGMATTAMGDNSHAEGRQTVAIGTASHAQGRQSIATDTGSHAEGNNTISCHENSHAEGDCILAAGRSSHAEGILGTGSSIYTTISPVTISDISGKACKITGASTLSQLASGDVLLIDNIPYRIQTIYSSSNRFSFNTTILFDTSVTSLTWIRKGAFGEASHVEGNSTVAKGDASHSEGYYTQANGNYSHAEGSSTNAAGENAHAEGYYTEANGDHSHAEGERTEASGTNSHAEGDTTLADGQNSHAEGDNTAAMGANSHAEGSYTTASGANSHASGSYTSASGDNAFVVGKYGVANQGVLFGVGNGTSESSTKLAFEVRDDDTAYVDGKKVLSEADGLAQFADQTKMSNMQPAAIEELATFIEGSFLFTFDEPNGASNQLGLCAQQLQSYDSTIASRIVSTDTNGNLVVRSDKLVYLLIAAIQKLRSDVDTLMG